MPSRPAPLKEQDEDTDANYSGDDSDDAFGHCTFQLEFTFNSTNAITLGKVTISMGKIRRRTPSSLMSSVRCGFSSNDSSWSYPNSIRGRNKGRCLMINVAF
jgi:hypothetical protein